MGFKKMIFVLASTTTIIFVCMFGGSYAYYVSSDGTTLNVTTGNFDTGLAVVFNQNQYINLKTGIPLTTEQVDELASKTIFTLIPDAEILTGYDAAITITLTDVSISEELRISDFHYDLSCLNSADETVINNNFTGASITDEDLTNKQLVLGTLSTSDNTFSIDESYTCTLRVWLQSTESDQNTLMNKKFSGLVKVNSAFRK